MSQEVRLGLSWLLHIPLGLLFSLSPAKVHSSTLFIVVAYQPSDYTPSFMADLDCDLFSSSSSSHHWGLPDCCVKDVRALHAPGSFCYRKVLSCWKFPDELSKSEGIWEWEEKRVDQLWCVLDTGRGGRQWPSVSGICALILLPPSSPRDVVDSHFGGAGVTSRLCCSFHPSRLHHLACRMLVPWTQTEPMHCTL